MNGVPKTVWYVHHDRNMGSSKGCEFYDDGPPIVVGGVTTSQGDRNTVYRAKGGREVSRYGFFAAKPRTPLLGGVGGGWRRVELPLDVDPPLPLPRGELVAFGDTGSQKPIPVRREGGILRQGRGKARCCQ